MPPYQSRSEARAHLRKLRLQCSNQSQSESFEQKARLGVSPKQREARAVKSASGGLRGRSPRGRRLGEEHPSHQPGRWGRSWASRPSRCAVAARALTPIHSDSAPQAPARASGAFSSGGRVKGLVRPAAPQGRGHGPLTRPERPKPAGRVSGALFPGTPAPRREAPAGSPEALIRRAVQGAPPAWGSKGRAAPWACTATKKPSAEGEHFLLFELRSSALHGPQKGPKSKRQKGNPGKPRIAGFWASQCNLPRLPCSL